MVFILICFIFVIVSIFILRKAGISNPYSKGYAIAIGISIIAVVCLAQNYTQSLIPAFNDGIGISNQLAYWIIGEDHWSQEVFKNVFVSSIYLALFLIVAYPVILVIETKMIKKFV